MLKLGAVLFEQESLPEALKDYNNAHEIYQSLESRVSSAFSQANRVNILWRLGEYDQAKHANERDFAHSQWTHHPA
jgi:tetratricopeptide (TPR) repeat protein